MKTVDDLMTVLNSFCVINVVLLYCVNSFYGFRITTVW